jgi:hypothetical protein
MKPALLAMLLMAATGTACTSSTSSGATNPTAVCDVEPQWALMDTLGMKGHDSPQDAAAQAGRERPDLPQDGWYVVRRDGDRAFLAPPEGPWRLEASRVDNLGWVVFTGLLCTGPSPGHDARPPLTDDAP